MELLICALAALAAGVGTGLAGLSAATVMVPVMIVLCPSFAGETGAYHATAIALASVFYKPSWRSAMWATLGILVTVVVQAAMNV